MLFYSPELIAHTLAVCARKLHTEMPVEIRILGLPPIVREDSRSAGLEKPLDFPRHEVRLADIGRHAEQSHDKVELLLRFGPVILERRSDQSVAEFGMLVSEDAQHPSTGIDADIVLRLDVPEAEVHESPGAAADVQNVGPLLDLQRVVYPLASNDVSLLPVDPEVVGVGNGRIRIEQLRMNGSIDEDVVEVRPHRPVLVAVRVEPAIPVAP